MEQDILDEQHHGRKHPKPKKTSLSKPFLAIVVLIIVVGISFYGGVDYQKHHQVNSVGNVSAARISGQGGFNGSQYRGDRVIGQVTAISSTSISIQNMRTSTIDTLAITSSTQITDNGQTVASSDIQTGDTVFVTENSSNTSQASSILVNPSFGGSGGSSSQPGSSSTQNTITN